METETFLDSEMKPTLPELATYIYVQTTDDKTNIRLKGMTLKITSRQPNKVPEQAVIPTQTLMAKPIYPTGMEDTLEKVRVLQASMEQVNQKIDGLNTTKSQEGASLDERKMKLEEEKVRIAAEKNEILKGLMGKLKT